MASLLSGAALPFVDSLCDPASVTAESFWGEFGRFTPCFVDIAILGTFRF